MRFLALLIKALLLLMLLSFAVMNSAPVTVRYWFGIEGQGPLSLFLIGAFVAGALVGIAFGSLHAFRRRRNGKKGLTDGV